MKTSQKILILNHLHEKGEITPFEAWVIYGVYRLSSVIHRLRQEGYDIRTEINDDYDVKNNRKVQFAKYKYSPQKVLHHV